MTVIFAYHLLQQQPKILQNHYSFDCIRYGFDLVEFSRQPYGRITMKHYSVHFFICMKKTFYYSLERMEMKVHTSILMN